VEFGAAAAYAQLGDLTQARRLAHLVEAYVAGLDVGCRESAGEAAQSA